MPRFHRLTKEEERQLIVINLAASLSCLAHDLARLEAALEWATPDEILEALTLIEDEAIRNICRTTNKNRLLGASG
ncbi:MAG TPA: hypothetical protein DD990_09565 [Cyanobacteria bacterium UBA11368]|nr:hypothetical protein [Cyanobacteria bacterium UBA11368]